jgi:hypothetical protein
MKKIIVLLVICTCLCSAQRRFPFPAPAITTTPASPIYYDAFNYAAGNLYGNGGWTLNNIAIRRDFFLVDIDSTVKFNGVDGSWKVAIDSTFTLGVSQYVFVIIDSLPAAANDPRVGIVLRSKIAVDSMMAIWLLVDGTLSMKTWANGDPTGDYIISGVSHGLTAGDTLCAVAGGTPDSIIVSKGFYVKTRIAAGAVPAVFGQATNNRVGLIQYNGSEGIFKFTYWQAGTP